MLTARCQVGLGGRDETIALVGDRLPVVRGEELAERAHGKPVLLDLLEDASLRVVQLRRRRREALPRGAVREQAVVELVRRPDALSLDRLRDTVRAVREHAIHTRGEGRRLPVHVRPRRRPRSPTLPAQPVTSVFYLFRDSPQRRAALALEPGSAARYAL